MACTLAVDATSSIIGAALSASSCKSRSVPIFYLRRAGIVVCGSLTFVALRSSDTTTVVKASLGSLAALLTLGRWDNARAELAPRWEPHGSGASDAKGEIWATLTVYVTGAAYACCLKKLTFYAPLAGVAEGSSWRIGRSGVNLKGSVASALCACSSRRSSSSSSRNIPLISP